VLKRFYCNYTA